MTLAVTTAEKHCNGCDRDLPVASFPWQNKAKGYRASRCRDCRNAQKRAWDAANPEVKARRTRAYYEANRERINERKREQHRQAFPEVRAARLERIYGITIEQYNEMLKRQGGVCAICQGEETVTRAGTIRALSVDHCHETGAVRGLLCANCNTFIGMAGDDVMRLHAATEYLVKHMPVEPVELLRST